MLNSLHWTVKCLKVKCLGVHGEAIKVKSQFKWNLIRIEQTVVIAPNRNENTSFEFISGLFNYIDAHISNSLFGCWPRRRIRYPPTGQARTVPQKQWAAVITHLWIDLVVSLLAICKRGYNAGQRLGES